MCARHLAHHRPDDIHQTIFNKQKIIEPALADTGPVILTHPELKSPDDLMDLVIREIVR
jgi:hypothetical protein